MKNSLYQELLILV